ncbi:hypothetical protein LY78DRAFT_591969, partial [Colletotrichum sublineola]
NEDVVQLLIQNGADLEIRDELNRTPAPASKATTAIAQLLIQAGSNVQCRDNEGATPIARAFESGNLDNVLLLIKLPYDAYVTDQRGRNMLYYLAVGLDP